MKRKNLPVTRAKPALGSSRTPRVAISIPIAKVVATKEKNRYISDGWIQTIGTAAVGQKTMRHKSRTAAGSPWRSVDTLRYTLDELIARCVHGRIDRNRGPIASGIEEGSRVGARHQDDHLARRRGHWLDPTRGS